MLNEFIGALRYAAASTVVTLMLLWALERIAPRSPVSWSSQLRSLRYWAFYLVAGALFATLSSSLVAALGAHRIYALPLASWLRSTPFWWTIYVLGPIAGMLLYDFFNYWMHRAQHKWFWRQHAIHHSIENLSAINSYFHPTEDLFRIAFITIPMSLIGVATGPATLASVIIVGAWGNYLHTASRLNMGSIGRRFLADNVYHRVHHSREERHFDVNFATATPIWDWIFGTVYWPKTNEWPASGVHDAPEPSRVTDFLFRPFVPKSSLSEAASGASVKAHDRTVHEPT